MFSIIISIIGGLIASSSLLLKHTPISKVHINKILPLQTIIGLLLIGWGVWGAYQFVTNFTAMGFNLIFIASFVSQLLVGIILTYDYFSKNTVNNSESTYANNTVNSKLGIIKTLAGLVLLGIGIWSFLVYL